MNIAIINNTQYYNKNLYNHQTTFKAKLDKNLSKQIIVDELWNTITTDFNSVGKEIENATQIVLNINQNLDKNGSKDTTIKIESIKDKSHTEQCNFNEIKDSSNKQLQITYPVYEATIKFHNPLTPDAEGCITIKNQQELKKNKYRQVAETINEFYISEGEKSLLIDYADKNKHSLLDSFNNNRSKFIEKWINSDFSDYAKEAFLKYIKCLNLQQKLETTIKTIKLL